MKQPKATHTRPMPWLPVMLAITLLAGYAALARGADQDVLKDPVALGAWLYVGNCVTCHQDYGTSRLAEDYDDEEELSDAIASESCEVQWSRQYGGKLANEQVEALARYMLAWEEEGQAPSLPELPPQPKVVIETADPDSKKGYVLPTAEKKKLAPALEALLQQNPVVSGAWLYINNCYRCHLDYTKARMGKGVSAESLQNTITYGKTSTQMLAFSNLLGGELNNGQIRDITTYITTWEKYQEPLAISSRVLKPPAADPAAMKPVELPKFARVSGDAAGGLRLFRLNCRRCHGAAGGGRIGPRLAKTWFSMRPDLYIKSVLKTGVPGGLMKGWSQSAGGPLAAKDIADLTGLLQSWAPSQSGGKAQP